MSECAEEITNQTKGMPNQTKETNNQFKEIKMFQCTFEQYTDREHLTPKPLSSDKDAD